MRPTQLLNLLVRNAKRGEVRAEGSTIFLYDIIVGDDFEASFFGGVSPQAFLRELSAIKGDVTVRINSPGGDVFGARAMAQAMREHDGAINVIIDGLCASAATFLAATASKVAMAPGSFLMIHNASTMAYGDAADFKATAVLLDKVDATIAQSYAAKSGGKPEDFATMMAAETWFTPEEAKDVGLCDEVIADGAKPAALWDLSAFTNAPKAETPEVTAEPDPAPETVSEGPEPSAEEQVASPTDETERATRVHAAARLARVTAAAAL